MFQPENFTEASYSAPLARESFYGTQPLLHPGAHLLGTDLLGRDVVYRTLKGARVALLIGGLTSLSRYPYRAFFLASPPAISAAALTTLFSSSWQCWLPYLRLLLLIALIMVLGRGTVQVCVALGVTGWVHFCRISRGETLKLREADFVSAARALGVSDRRIICAPYPAKHRSSDHHHVRPVVHGAGAIGDDSSYLGIGLDGSWGQMIDQARNELSRTPIIWWNLAGASVALFMLVLCVNMLADAMRDIIDPRTRRER